MVKRINIVRLCLISLLSIGYLLGQGEKKVRLFVNGSNYPEIELIVSARDAKTGEAVYGLRKPDFTIFEKGDKQEITSFIAVEREGADVIDIVFLFDQTGSMGDEIGAVKDNALLFADILKKSSIDYRIALIAFSDKIEKKFDFTSDIEKFKSQVASIRAVGGGDAPENGLEALKQAAGLEFRNNARIAFTLITDAPYHEKDHFTDLSMKPLIKRIALRGIQVYPIAVKLPDYLWIAKETNGVYFNIKSDFSSIIEELAYGLTAQYKLRYITSHPCTDGDTVGLKLKISPLATSTPGEYKRPLNLKQLDLNIFYEAKQISLNPQNPIECDVVSFLTRIRATSCSDTAMFENIVVHVYEVKPGDRKEVAQSEPVKLKSNGQPQDAFIEWNTTGYRGDRNLEFIIVPPKKLLEKNKGDNIIRKKIKISEVSHDLYIESIEYSPDPAAPCDVVKLSVKVNDGTKCEGLILHNIEVEALDGTSSLGRINTSITVGKPEAINFEWDVGGVLKPKRLKFIVDPDHRFGKELTLKNNVKEILVNVRPVQHDLFPVSVVHEPKRPIVGDTISFHVEVEDKARCPEAPLGQNIQVRLSNADNRVILSQSKPFTMSSQSSVLVPIRWTTKLRDHGERKFLVILDPQRKIRELTPPGRSNNTLEYSVNIRPMPHDLVIKSATITPKSPRDGDPATLDVVLHDNARFPGVRLEGVQVKAYERYSKALLGQSDSTFIHSKQEKDLRFQIDTGGYAGNREIMLVVDPDNRIKELTPKGLDGENNNRYFFRVPIRD